MPKNFLKPLFVFLGVVFLVVSIFPLLRSDFIWTHDSNLYPAAFYEFDQGIRAGDFLPRWSPDFWLGLGSPFFNFVQPLFFYITEIFHLIGFGIINSIKITIVLGIIIGFLGMYLFSRGIWGHWGGLISSIIYAFFPYRLALIYVRGDFAEYFATALIPWVLFLLTKSWQTKKTGYLLSLTAVFCLLILMHNIQTLFLTPVVIIYWLILTGREFFRSLKIFLPAFLLGLGMASFFFLPAFFEKKYLLLEAFTRGSFDFHINFLSMTDLIKPIWDPWHFFQFGIINLFIIFPLIFIFTKKLLNNWQKRNLIYFLLIFVFSLLMTLPISVLLWEKLPLLKYIQFPWRFLSLTALAFALISGGLVKYDYLKAIKKIFKLKTLIILLIIFVFINIGFIKPFTYINAEPDEKYHPLFQLTSDANIFYEPAKDVVNFNLHNSLPILVPDNTRTDDFIEQIKKDIIEAKFKRNNEPLKPLEKVQIQQGKGDWQIIENDPQNIKIKLFLETDTELTINQFWFPGWRAYLNNQEVTINHDNQLQIMAFNISAGEYTLLLKFRNTPIRQAANIISIISWLIWLYLLYNYLRNKKIPLASAR